MKKKTNRTTKKASSWLRGEKKRSVGVRAKRSQTKTPSEIYVVPIQRSIKLKKIEKIIDSIFVLHLEFIDLFYGNE